jgi:hypothetical protein
MSFGKKPRSAGTGEPASPAAGAPQGDPAPIGDAPVGDASLESPAAARSGERQRARANMLPGRERRRFGIERIFVRLVATGGIIGIGVVLGAILASSKVQGWIIGLVVAIVSVVISGILWSSRRL